MPRTLPLAEWTPRSHDPECVKMYVSHHDELAVRQIVFELVAEATRLDDDRDRSREIIDSLYDAISIDWNKITPPLFTKEELEYIDEHLRWCLENREETRMTSFTTDSIFEKIQSLWAL